MTGFDCFYVILGLGIALLCWCFGWLVFGGCFVFECAGWVAIAGVSLVGCLWVLGVVGLGFLLVWFCLTDFSGFLGLV